MVGRVADRASMRRAIVQPQPFSLERPRLFRPMRTDPEGRSGPTPKAARGTGYRRTSRGLYLPAAITDELPEQRIVEAAENLPDFGAVTGWAALRWRGARWFSGRRADGGLLPVPLATGYADILNQPGHLVNHERIGPDEIEQDDGLPVTSVLRSVYFALRHASGLRAAVVVADMTAFEDLVSIDELWAYALAHPGWTGAPQAREAIRLADENSWSPRETDCRLCWRLDAGLPAVLANHPIFDRAGRQLATPDLLDPVAGVVVEYNGEVHLDPALRRTDIGREELYRALGLEVVVVTAGMTRESVAARMMAAHRRAAFEAESARRWTVQPPPWWVPTTTVARRRSLDEGLRDRLLGYRRLAG